MASAWKKTLTYLGLVEEDDDFDAVERAPMRHAEPGVSRFSRPSAVRPVDDLEPSIRTMAMPRATASSIHKCEPKRFNEIPDISDRFKDGVPVIMNLQGTEDTTARRLIDFASGLVYGLDGRLELVANRVYLLTPQNVDVSAEDRERLAGGGFFNQF
jgi:cell division inhibitor SepF